MASSSKEVEKREEKLKHEDMTPLQKHVAFFDRNKDGLIYPWETFRGMRAIGSGIVLSIAASLFINGTLGPKTRPGKFPSLLFPIYVKNISKGKHDSDTDAYDSEGRFVPEKFEEIFKKYAKTKPDALTSKELDDMLQGNKESKGQFAAMVEWKVLLLLAKDKDGFLSKDTIMGVYDGTLFPKLEQERSSSRKK
ncbi:putative peroxygenase 4 isoform X1 [Carex rostrata]